MDYILIPREGTDGDSDIWPVNTVEECDAASAALRLAGIESTQVWCGDGEDGLLTGSWLFWSEAAVDEKIAERQRMAESLTRYGVPRHLHDGLIGYFVDHHPVGGALSLILDDSLSGAYRRGDPETLAGISSIVRWLNDVPSASAWGSSATRLAWLAAR